MLLARALRHVRRRDHRIILHFDYDCFYAAVFEAEDPALKSLPLGVQQKQIIVTCNYVARQKGLHKLQLITEAKRICPEAVIVLGEDLTRFRDASRLLYNTLRSYSWSDRVEKLGFDEVWMDVTDMIDYNVEVLNKNDFANSFFHLSLSDPTVGFTYDASRVAGHVYPASTSKTINEKDDEDRLRLRLILGSHLAFHLRHKLDEEYGYTSTVGISTSKMLSKLVGNKNKPKGQTTLMPPYDSDVHGDSNVLDFLDEHDVGAIPWIGFKLAQKLRECVLNRPAAFEAGLVYGPTREKVTVKHIRDIQGFSLELLERLLSGPGVPHDIGAKVYCLLHGIDDSDVNQARSVPHQISIEDSYVRLDTMDQVLQELKSLTSRLLQRMRIDLTEMPDEEVDSKVNDTRWLAHPTTLRLTTRPRLPLNADGTRTRTFKRISRSTPLPLFVFNLLEPIENLVDRLIKEALVPLFKKLHPERSGWNLSLVNVAVTGMEDEAKVKRGANIGVMFKNMEKNGNAMDFPDEDEVEAVNVANLDARKVFPNHSFHNKAMSHVEKHEASPGKDTYTGWEPWDNESSEELSEPFGFEFLCEKCGSRVPSFARTAHERFHALGD